MRPRASRLRVAMDQAKLSQQIMLSDAGCTCGVAEMTAGADFRHAPRFQKRQQDGER